MSECQANPQSCVQGGEEWAAAQRDSLSGLGAAEIPAGRGEGPGEGATPMARAQALLALTAVPRTMPCRDNERAAITAFVEESLSAGADSSWHFVGCLSVCAVILAAKDGQQCYRSYMYRSSCFPIPCKLSWTHYALSAVSYLGAIRSRYHSSKCATNNTLPCILEHSMT